MLNFPLFKSMLKANGRSIVSYGLGSFFYMWLIISIYPSIAENPGMNDLIKSMPEELLKAFGLRAGIEDLAQFIAGEFYGLLYILILAIFSVMTANQLIARFVDRGSMAYLLATPVSRTKIAITQATVLCVSLLLICFLTTLGGFAGVSVLLDDFSLDQGAFIKLNIVGLLVFFVISGYSFVFSCLFNDEKRSLGASAGLTLLFYVADLFGKMSDKFDWLLNFSIFSAFKPQEIVRGEVEIVATSVGLAVAGILLYLAAVLIFRKRDLSL